MGPTTRLQAWRATLDPLRTLSSTAALSTAGVFAVLSTAVSQLSNNLAAVFELPSQEVAGDVILLVQSVPVIWPTSEATEYSNVCMGICRLVSDVSFRVQLEYKPDAVVILVRFLRRLLEGPNVRHAKGAEEEADKASMQQGAKAESEALKVLVPVIHEHGAQLSAEEASSLISVLVRVAKQLNFAAAGHFRRNRGSWHERSETIKEAVLKPGQEEREYQRLVFTAIGNLFIRAGTLVSQEDSTLVIKALRNTLETMTSTKLVEDAAASRCYAAVLRCVHLVVSEARSSVEDHVVGLVGALRAYFMYGLHSPGSAFISSKTGQSQGTPDRSGLLQDTKSKSQGNGAYRPPHMRGKPSLNSGKPGSSDVCSDVERQRGWGCASSDSELSDSDGHYEEGDRFKCSKVRTSAVLSVQALARAEPKVLHAHWLDLLPTHDVLQPWPFQATLFTVLIFDPVLKARMAAASTVALMLEGPARAYLQVAEHKEFPRSKSFTTLSSSLGQLVIQLLTGLVHVITNEAHSGILVSSFKALSLLVSASPFSRLPGQLLPYVVSSVHQKARDIYLSLADQSNIMCAAISCIGVALSCTPPQATVAEALLMEATPKGSSARTPSGNSRSCSHLLLPDLISYTLPPTSAAVRVEAFQALKAAVHTYPFILSKHWELISHSIVTTIKHGKQLSGPEEPLNSLALRSEGKQVAEAVSVTNAQPARLAEDKVLHSAIKLLDEFLRATCGHQRTDELPDDGFLQPPASSLDSGAHTGSETPTNDDFQFENVDSNTALTYWMGALCQHLPPALAHPAPMVRGAALTCFAGLTSGTFSLMSSENQGHIFSVLIHAAWNDDTPAVRSAACRAIGVVMGFSQVAGSKEKLGLATEVISRATTDTSVAVRITASWALANICDALRNMAETRNAVDKEDQLAKFSLAPLAECALKAAKDCDKVRANAVRALGNLARFSNFGDPSELPAMNLPIDMILWTHSSVHQDLTEPDTAEANKWLEMLVQTLVSCVTTGNVKVQWNVCHALGNLFLNKTIRLPTMTWVPSVYSILLLLLRDSANFKIRIHSAAALAVPVSREDYGESYNDVLKALVHALECMNADHHSAPTSFKYNQALTEQLTNTVIHVLGLAIPQDFLGLKDFLLKKAGFLIELLSCECAGEEPLWTDDSNDIDQAVEVSLNLTDEPNISGSVYDERPLPLPKEHHRRHGLHVNDSLLTLNGRRFRGFKDCRKAAYALADMYRYGGVTKALQKLEVLIA